jgi:nucleoid DNA-binding protein
MKTKLCKIQNIETEKKELLDVMQAWHGLSKYNSATAVSIYAQSIKKNIKNQVKLYIKIEIINVSK